MRHAVWLGGRDRLGHSLPPLKCEGDPHPVWSLTHRAPWGPVQSWGSDHLDPHLAGVAWPWLMGCPGDAVTAVQVLEASM